MSKHPSTGFQKNTWKFNTPGSPYQSGTWERLVCTYKHVFYPIIGDRYLTDGNLVTVFCLVDYAMNARLLTPVISDPSDTDGLTPNHFLLGRWNTVPNLVGKIGWPWIAAEHWTGAILSGYLKRLIPATITSLRELTS